MKIGIQAAGLLAVTAMMFGCSPAPTTNDPSTEQSAQSASASTTPPDAKPTGGAADDMTSPGKTSPPVKTTLTSSGSTGTVVLTLTIEALADIPRGVGRIVIPNEGRMGNGQVKVVSGDLEKDFGALPHGEKRELQVTVEVPAGSGGRLQVFAGVDCHMTPGIKLHKPATPVTLGQ